MLQDIWLVCTKGQFKTFLTLKEQWGYTRIAFDKMA
jgi:hypothetical protein